MEPQEPILPWAALDRALSAPGGVARAWEELRLLARHGPCRNCERLHGVLVELQRARELHGGNAQADRLLAAIRGVRRPPELHPPLGCQPCSTEAALTAGNAAEPFEVRQWPSRPARR
jgi:hypothetical protein